MACGRSGRLVLGQWRGLDARVIWQHLLGWLVKGFFLPLMFTYFCDDLGRLLNYNPSLLRYDVSFQQTFKRWYDWSYSTIYFIDVSLVSMTYLMSLKATDTQIRSTEPTAAGWLVPWCAISRSGVSSAHSTSITTTAAGRVDLRLINLPWLYVLWGSLIICPGHHLRLGHRRIRSALLESDPSRHHYQRSVSLHQTSRLSVEESLVVDDIDAVHGQWRDCARCCGDCVCCWLLNLIYYLRAKTEERHLALDPVYVQLCELDR